MAQARLLHVGQGQELVVGGGAEVTKHLALERAARHVASHALDGLGVEHVRVVHREDVPAPLPRDVGLGLVHQLREQVHALRRADEHTPPAAVGEHGLDNFCPNLGLHVLALVEHGTIRADAAHSIRVVRAHHADRRAVVPELDPQLALVDLRERYLPRVTLEPLPRNQLRLLELRREVDVEAVAPRAAIAQRIGNHVHEHELGLAAAAVDGEHVEQLLRDAEVLPRLPRPRLVAEVHRLALHSSPSFFGSGTPVTTVTLMSPSTFTRSWNMARCFPASAIIDSLLASFTRLT